MTSVPTSTPISSPEPAPTPTPGYRRGGASVADIKNNLPQGNTPMDIINQIIAKEEPFDPQRIADATREVHKQEQEENSAQMRTITEEPPQKEVTPTPEVAPEESTQEEPSLQDRLLGKEKDSTAENFKKLRTSNRELKEAHEKALSELEEIRKRLEGYQTGTEIPDYVIEKEKELEELRHLQKLHAVKTSKEYRQKFIEPIESTKNRLYELADEYKVPRETIEQALQITDRRTLGNFVTTHFEDVDALEAKKLILDVHALGKKALEAEVDAGKLLQELQEEGERIRQQQEINRRKSISDKARDGWTKSLRALREEGKALEFIPKADNPEYNAKYVEPIQKAASTEFGKIVSMLGELGLTELPDDLAFALARMSQLAHASAFAMETRDNALVEKQKIETNTRRTNGFIRPNVGGGYSHGAPQAPQRPETREDRINSLIDQGRKNAQGR